MNHRRKVRQRRIMLCLGGVALVFALLWNISFSSPRYTWLTLPPVCYKPEMISAAAEESGTKLTPLPVKAEDSALRQKLEAELATYAPELKPHLYYFNLQDHGYVNIDGSQAVPAASVIKLPLLLAYFQHVEAGKLTPYQHLIYEPFEQADGSGTLQYRPPGQPLPAHDVVTMMIQTSDNTCTNMLIYHLGGTDVLNRRFRELGLHRTHLANWLPDLPGTNVVSMEDMALVLYNLARSPTLNASSRQAAVNIMLGTHNRRLIPALLPKETPVAQKTGDIGISLGNTGLVTLPNGQQYILALQVERSFNDYRARDMIQRVSKLIYDELMIRSGSEIIAQRT